MSPLFAFDGAGPFDLAAAKRAGGIAVTVYIVGTPGGMPHADRARVDAARAAGLGVLPNWERQADYFLTCTMAQAQWAAKEAVTACRELGFPDDGTIACAFSFDVDIPASRFVEMGAKVAALITGLGGAYRLMLYGQQALIDWLAAHGYITGKSWLMMSTFNQPYNPRSPNVCMVQEHDIDGNWLSSPLAGTDINTITDPAALHAWWPPNSPYGDDDMSAADVKAIIDDLHPAIGRVQANVEQGQKLQAAAVASLRLQIAAAQKQIDAVAVHLDDVAAAVQKLQAGAVLVTPVVSAPQQPPQ